MSKPAPYLVIISLLKEVCFLGAKTLPAYRVHDFEVESRYVGVGFYVGEAKIVHDGLVFLVEDDPIFC